MGPGLCSALMKFAFTVKKGVIIKCALFKIYIYIISPHSNFTVSRFSLSNKLPEHMVDDVFKKKQAQWFTQKRVNMKSSKNNI